MRDALLAAGEVGRDLLAVDWAATPLGPLQAWPQSLRTMVRAMLANRFSMWMAWGPDLTFFCNEAYRRNTLGRKYPWALGRPASEVWAEIWPDISPRIDKVLATGDATWDEALLLFLERSGYTEETYHTFSYSPLTGDDGAIAGMLCVVSEDTERVIGQRRLGTLRDLGSDPNVLRTEEDVLVAARRHLGHNPYDLPFTLVYLLDADGAAARLAASSGIPAGHPAAPALIAVGDKEAPWPVAEPNVGEAATITDLAERFADLPTGAWPEPPCQALVLPLPAQGQAGPYGYLVAGLNPFRPLDAAFHGFVDLIAGQLAAGLAAARAYAAERRRAEQLAELDRAKTAFFTNVSHEFRTPLTLLLGPAEDALADEHAPLAPRQRERVEVIHRSGLRLLTLVNNLLDFSRLESGRATAHFQPMDLARYTVELASMFDSAVHGAGLTLTIDAPELPEPVYVDREMWAKIVLNLLSNALKFTFAGGITLRLRAVDGAAELAVTDTGIGIEAAEQERLFERFHRVAGAPSRTYEGSGIGLALVAELAALHGGRAGVTSTPGSGSTFTVVVRLGREHLPADQVSEDVDTDLLAVPGQAAGLLAEAMRWIDDEADDADGADGADEQPAPVPGAPRTRPMVLVVDDNNDMRDYVARLLADDYDVVTAPDGLVGLEKALADPPDLVLTDVMMPRLDGFGLLDALRSDPATVGVPVVMLSARAGEEGTAEGLEAGADDYLAKPFSARELLARVRSNLELDRVRRTRDELERSRGLLSQAQRLARVGSWEIDLADEAISGSEEYFRLLGVEADELRHGGVEAALRYVHPADVPLVAGAIEASRGGVPLRMEFRIQPREGGQRLVQARGELYRDAAGNPAFLRGSLQDVTEQREAEQEVAAAAAVREAAAREHTIADELQRSLLPSTSFNPDHLEVATYYNAGVEGTQVGGDWYDVIELGAGRTALVIGDVMGRGVRAAAVMGQLRSATRAYARLDLPPADVLEFLDSVVRDLGEDQIVTVVYAVYDPADRSLTHAIAGHLPPLLAVPGEPVRRLTATPGPPLGTGPFTLEEQVTILPLGSTVALFTDGLVERRDRDLEVGLEQLAAALQGLDGDLERVPGVLVDALLPDGQDDDVAVLVARVPDGPRELSSTSREIAAERSAVSDARDFVSATLASWSVAADTTDDVVLMVSELVTNAVIYGRPPIELRLRRTAEQLVVEVYDAATFLPRRLRPTLQDEHGRGLQLVSLLADRWGTRPTAAGKSVWFLVQLSG
jgi:PAS domain S-box-containing protein